MENLQIFVFCFVVVGVVGFVLHLIAAQIARFANEFIRIFATSLSMYLCITLGSILTMFSFMSPLEDELCRFVILVFAAWFVLALIPFVTLLMTKQRPMVGEEFTRDRKIESSTNAELQGR